MTLLVGNSTTTGYTTGAAANGLSGTRLILDSWTATVTGTATTLFLYARLNNTPNVKLCIYSSGNTLLGNTGAIAIAEGWVSAALGSSVSITSGQVYKLGWYADAGYTDYYTDAGGTVSVYDGGSYTTPASSISPVADGGVNRFLMYADGTAASGPAPSEGSVTFTGNSSPLNLKITPAVARVRDAFLPWRRMPRFA